MFGAEYPEDIKYNVCQIGRYAIHNFNFTDKKVLEVIENKKIDKIQVNQGYSNCSIAVINEKSAITSDKTISKELEKSNVECMYFENNSNIKLFDANGNFSKMNGFIGGAIGKIQDKIIIFGDLSKIDKSERIRNFIKQSRLELIEFKGLDVIDYGGIITIN